MRMRELNRSDGIKATTMTDSSFSYSKTSLKMSANARAPPTASYSSYIAAPTMTKQYPTASLSTARTFKPRSSLQAPPAMTTRLYATSGGLESAANSQRSCAPKMSMNTPKYGFSGSLATSTLSGKAKPRKSMLMMAAASTAEPEMIPDMAKR